MAKPDSVETYGGIGDDIDAKSVVLTLGDLPGRQVPTLEGRTTRGGKLMTRQKSEDPIVPEGRRKSAPPARARGGKGVPVDQVVGQLGLPLTTAVPRRGRSEEVLAPRWPWPKVSVRKNQFSPACALTRTVPSRRSLPAPSSDAPGAVRLTSPAASLWDGLRS